MRLRRVAPILVLIVFLVALTAASSHAALSPAELALYKGADREKILLDGAKKEGQVVFYTSNTWVAGPVSQEFEKRYPFVKANVWRSDSKALLKRLTEEVTAGRRIADVVETSPEYMTLILRDKMLQEHFERAAESSIPNMLNDWGLF